MNNQLEKRYGLLTAIAMVVGIVIGSGVFFKAEKILTATGGNLPLGILAWVLGGLVMLACAYTFAVMATKYEYVNGIIDYADVSMGHTYGYFVGWFMAVVYYPTLTAVLAWVSARYTAVLLGWDILGGPCMLLAGFYLVLAFVLNTLSPVLSGKFQVSTTIIKLVPLLLMAVVGTGVGLSNGMMAQNFTTVVMPVSTGTGLFTAVVASAFAYEGWIIATGINAELKNAKRNLPIALITGTFIIMLVYVSYYVGMAGTVSNAVMMQGGENAARLAFESIFTKAGGTIIFVIIIISCLGTLNGLMLGCVRGIYGLAARGRGPKPQIFCQVDPVIKMPLASCVLGLLFASVWLFYFYGSNLVGPSWFGFFTFDPSELPIITLYASYIPIFLTLMKREVQLGKFQRFVMPSLSIIGCLFMITAACFAHGKAVFAYLITFAVIMLIGCLFAKEQKL